MSAKLVVMLFLCSALGGLSAPDRDVAKVSEEAKPIAIPMRLCLDNDDCPADEYCLKRPGRCAGRGTCVDRLDDLVQCLDVWDPVCGCDGQTYSNACYAQKAAVSIDYAGECLAACDDNDDCQSDEYCVKPLGECDGTGQCVERLDDLIQCFAVWDPVCGCDGQTYSNACYAQKAAVSIDYLDECGGDPWPDPEPVPVGD